MEAIQLKRNNWYMMPLIIAVSITLFLFFIDEGYYNFNWMKDPRNWFWFFFYSGGFFLGQVTIQQGFFKNKNSGFQFFLSSFLGIIFGIACLMAMFIVLAMASPLWKY